MLSKTDSANEQAKETPIARTTKNINSPTFRAVGAAATAVGDAAPAAHTECGNISANAQSTAKKV
ncbi:hypothetical protein GCM10027424_23650 [Psychrobacter pacificensis]|uniref:Uncharacterized protein n=1 Tax=Psychrobacter pacificensis TaxID=112002 RepID=A0ABQ5YZE7_9GAMM|nr:hypothetical protein GCM10007915_00950 [Psychrobacter pacificensis]